MQPGEGTGLRFFRQDVLVLFGQGSTGTGGWKFKSGCGGDLDADCTLYYFTARRPLNKKAE